MCHAVALARGKELDILPDGNPVSNRYNAELWRCEHGQYDTWIAYPIHRRVYSRAKRLQFV